MMLLRCLVTVFAALLAVLALAQSPPRAELVLPKSAVAGSTVKATLKLTFEPGLHGYQNPPTKDYMIPVNVESASKSIRVVPKYPKGTILDVAGEQAAVYEGLVSIPVAITMPKKPGPFTIKLTIGYQQCNKEACFPPDSFTVAAKILVKKPTKAKPR